MTTLPAEVEAAILAHFDRTHRDVTAAVKDYLDLGGGNYRVRLTYTWAARTIDKQYRYMTFPNGHTSTYQILRFHDGRECYGGFCPDCGW